MLLLYNFLLTLLWPLLYLYPPFRGTVSQRLGFFELGGYDPGAPGLKVLINAVSAGEVVAISSFIRELKRRLPDCQIVLLTTTQSGRDMALSKLAGLIDLCAYFPLVDLPFLARRYLERLQPAIYVTTEAELWPNIQLACHSRGIPVMLVNARLYLHNKRGLRGWVVRRLYQQCDLIVCQDRQQYDNFVKFGITPPHLFASGNTKFDFELEEWDGARVAERRARLGLSGGALVVAGSTHPGEEALLLDALRALRDSGAVAGVKAIIAPRHIERVEELERLAQQAGFRPVRLSRLAQDAAGEQQERDCVLVDSYGVLVDCYRLADAVVMGGTFHPKVGGHNILEATALGKPVLVGPYTFGIEAQVQMLTADAALIRVNSAGPEALQSALRDLLAQPAQARELGQRALQATLANRGAARRAVDAVLETVAGLKGGKPQLS